MKKPSDNNLQAERVERVHLAGLVPGSQVTFDSVDGHKVSIKILENNVFRDEGILMNLEIMSLPRLALNRRDQSKYWGQELVSEGHGWQCGDRDPKKYTTRITLRVQPGTLKVKPAAGSFSR